MSVKKLSRYDLVAVVGQGKLGPIWDGYDPDIRRKVTIKVAPVDQLSAAAAEAMATRFRAEARVAGKLTHPNIVGVYDAGVESGLAYIVTETVTGTTLDAMLRQPAGVAPEAMGRTMLQLLSALDYAHGRGVFHLGLQPSLLTVAANGSVKVSDFGAVAAAEPDDSTRAQGSLSEHIRFLAPEQVLGLEADARADLWAVGVMLFRLWTGQWPFQADSDFGLIQQIIKQPFALPSTLNVERGEEHDQLMGRALAKAAGDRYPNAREFAADLSRIMARGATAGAGAVASPRRAGDTAALDKPPAIQTPIPAPTAAPAASAEDELTWWRRIQLSDRPADFDAFLAVYPKGVCADLARTRLRRLAGAGEVPSAPPAGMGPRPEADDETRMSPLFMPKSLAPPAVVPPAPAPAPPPAPVPAPVPKAPAAASKAEPATRAAKATVEKAPKTPTAQAANPPVGKPWLPVAAGVVLIGAAAAWWMLRGGGASGGAAPAIAASAPAASAAAAVVAAPDAAPSSPQASASTAAAPAASVAVAADTPASAPAVIGAASAAPGAVATAAAATAAAIAAAPKAAVAAASAAAKPLTPREQAAARKAAADAAAKAKAAAALASTPAAVPRAVEEDRPRPAPVAEAPRPAEAPASVAAAPAQPCSGRVFLARLSCMKDACQQAQWSSHPQCVEFKRLDDANRGRRGENQ